MDLSNLAPDLGRLLGLNPSTVVLLIFIATTAAKVGARLIPDDATGALAVLRKLCTIVGVDVSNRITSGVSVVDVAKASLATPPIPEKVAEITTAEKAA